MKKGFTLVELLVVIGILGILAAGLLAAIDPVEQLRKGRDQNRRNIAVEYSNALTRFYSNQGSMPWGTSTTFSAASLGGTSTATVFTNQLVTSGELKTTFQQVGGNDLKNMSLAEENNIVYVCFKPESKALRGDPTTIFTDVTGGTGGSCPDTASAGTSCFWCAR